MKIEASISGKSHLNQIIYVELGQTVNISCGFDSSVNKRNLADKFSSNFFNRDTRRRRHRMHKKSLHLSKSSNHHYSESGDLFNANEYDSAVQDNNLLRYELDWYYLDKQGRMNIISYGNRTTKNKYKLFVSTKEKIQDYYNNDYDLDTAYNSRLNKNSLRYSSSALYSHDFTRHNKQQVYYLNALIESEDDEGVYQCINPDQPNFILSNVTIRIANNSASFSSKFDSKFCFIHLIFCYIFVSKIFCLI
jgi:hypothetical protein